MPHTRKAKRPEIAVPLDLYKDRTHLIETKAGEFEIDEFRDFYIVKKRLSKEYRKTHKGKTYDPTALVVAKKDNIVPFLPDRDFSRTFGFQIPFFVTFIGSKGTGGIYQQLKSFRKGGDILHPPLSRGVAEYMPPRPENVELGSSELANRIEKLIEKKKS